MKERCNCEVPCSVSGHEKAQKGPDSVVVKGGNKDSGGTASSEDISPSPLVQVVIYVIYVAVNNIKTLIFTISHPNEVTAGRLL